MLGGGGGSGAAAAAELREEVSRLHTILEDMDTEKRGLREALDKAEAEVASTIGQLERAELEVAACGSCGNSPFLATCCSLNVLACRRKSLLLWQSS